MSAARKIRVLVVDDSAIVRKVLSESLANHADIEVVGTAPDPFIARDKILALAPDVVTLDIEMPRMDGLTFLKKIMRHHPLPVIVISSLGQASSRAAIEALANGAVDVLCKPGGPYSVGELSRILADKVRAAASARIKRLSAASLPGAAAASPPSREHHGLRQSTVVAIGASTGGTEAIAAVLREIPPSAPGIVVTQHIPAGFSLAFANRLNQLCEIEVKEAVDGDEVRPGLALIAPGNFHMFLRKSGYGYSVAVKNGPRVCYQRPSVDVLFTSVAEVAAPDAIGVILTGMGSDGAEGLLKMKGAGAHTIAQDEASCVVFGMPREAIRNGSVNEVVPLPQIAGTILRALSRA
ncbi:MAG TPA: chemotaxis response regulator protein-glutamate methylesterase [Bryobacteraceae bacterium]|nr:chemotaxis response regulator protein-glutamate methylesterase [Bryobacteraceae bacterium]